jgi:hypothetical protein
MMPGQNPSQARAQLRVWWIIWAAILVGLCTVYYAFGRGPLPKNLPPVKSLTGLIGLVPLFVSIVIRWLVLPRYTQLSGALAMFVVGLALAEAGGVLGIFLGGVYRDDLFQLGVLGVVQYVPFFARQYLEPKPTGFIPNN